MSVSTIVNTVEFTGDGNDNSPYSFPYPLQSDGDIVLQGRTVATGAELTPLTLITDYTVALATDKSTATITLVSTTESDAVIASGVTLVIKRTQPLKQTTQWVTQNGTPSEVLELDFDDVALQLQYLQDQLDRCIKVQDTEPLANHINLKLPTLIGNALDPIIVNTDEDGFTIGTAVTKQVIGPASATDNALARFDGITGELIQNSSAILDDSGNISGLGTIASGSITTTGTITAGSGSEVLTNADGTIKQGAINSAIAGTGITSTSGVLSLTTPVVTDHGGLSGLGDDDHTQYALVTGSRSFTGTVTMEVDNVINGRLSINTSAATNVSVTIKKHDSAGTGAETMRLVSATNNHDVFTRLFNSEEDPAKSWCYGFDGGTDEFIISRATNLGNPIFKISDADKVNFSDDVTTNGAAKMLGRRILGAPVGVTISSGTFATTSGYHVMTGESEPDFLDTMTGGSDGEIVVLKVISDDPSATVQLAHKAGGTGDFLLDGGTAKVLTTTAERITLQYDAVLTSWVQLYEFSANPV